MVINKIINWLSSGELDSLRYKVEIYSAKISELMAAAENYCAERERLFHSRISDQSKLIKHQAAELEYLRHFEKIVMRQRAQKKAWNERNKKK
jgi:hypothetical protein